MNFKRRSLHSLDLVEINEVFNDIYRAIEELPIIGTGSPEGEIEAPVGKLYLDKDGGTSTVLYVKESGTGKTGWVAK